MPSLLRKLFGKPEAPNDCLTQPQREAIVVMGQGDKARILILSDDGKYPGRSDKNVFRGVWLQQANAPIGSGNGN